MFKTLLTAASLLVATPALAATPYAEATYSTDKNVGVNVGLSQPLTNAINGTVDVGIENFDNLRYNANVGLTARLAGPVAAYGRVGYLRRDGDNGYRLGGGLQLNLTSDSYVRGGVQRDDYGNGNDSVAGVVGLGLRF